VLGILGSFWCGDVQYIIVQWEVVGSHCALDDRTEIRHGQKLWMLKKINKAEDACDKGTRAQNDETLKWNNRHQGQT